MVVNNKEKNFNFGRATTHYDENFVSNFEKFNSNYILIPPGLTRFSRPLDVSINAQFKKYLHHWYIIFLIDNENKRKPTEIDIINAVVDL